MPTPLQPNVLHREQWIPAPVPEVFAFFSEVRNLDLITPPWLHFNVLGQSASLAAGTIIRYKLDWHGLPIRWTTRIEEWCPPVRFVDLQLKGPYSLWHHTHAFEARNGGTLMQDTVRYALPFGALGDFLAGSIVRADVARIFDFREQEIKAIFNKQT
jgi:hypothetical protein